MSLNRELARLKRVIEGPEGVEEMTPQAPLERVRSVVKPGVVFIIAPHDPVRIQAATGDYLQQNEADLLSAGIELRSAFARRDPMALLSLQVKLTQLAGRVSVSLLEFIVVQVEGWQDKPVSIGVLAATAPAELIAEISIAVTERIVRGLLPPARGREVLN